MLLCVCSMSVLSVSNTEIRQAIVQRYLTSTDTVSNLHRLLAGTHAIYSLIYSVIVIKGTQYAAQWSYGSTFFKPNYCLKSIPRV